jgi:hypothetical protein
MILLICIVLHNISADRWIQAKGIDFFEVSDGGGRSNLCRLILSQLHADRSDFIDSIQSSLEFFCNVSSTSDYDQIVFVLPEKVCQELDWTGRTLGSLILS